MSFTVNFQKPELPAPPARPVDPARMTRDERTSAGWQTLFVGWVVGLPSILSVAFVGIVGLWYAWQFTADVQTWLALSAGLIAITLFSAGMPIAAGLTWETQPVAAKAAAAFGVACVVMNFGVTLHFAQHKPDLPEASQAIARDMPGDEARELDLEIEWRREALADFDEGLSAQRTEAEARRGEHTGSPGQARPVGG